MHGKIKNKQRNMSFQVLLKDHLMHRYLTLLSKCGNSHVFSGKSLAARQEITLCFFNLWQHLLLVSVSSFLWCFSACSVSWGCARRSEKWRSVAWETMFHWKSLGGEYWKVDPAPWKSLTLFWEINIYGVEEECGGSWKSI